MSTAEFDRAVQEGRFDSSRQTMIVTVDTSAAIWLDRDGTIFYEFLDMKGVINNPEEKFEQARETVVKAVADLVDAIRSDHSDP